MTRAEIMKELDRIIDVGIVNAKHDSDVLRQIRKLLKGPEKVYVITSGCYSDYCIECVTLDKRTAEGFVKINAGNAMIEEYTPVEIDGEDEKTWIEIAYSTVENRIISIQFLDEKYFSDRYVSLRGIFEFIIDANGRAAKDLIEKGNDSELALKVCQDRYAQWKYENEVVFIGGAAGTRKSFDENWQKGESQDGRSQEDH